MLCFAGKGVSFFPKKRLETVKKAIFLQKHSFFFKKDKIFLLSF